MSTSCEGPLQTQGESEGATGQTLSSHFCTPHPGGGRGSEGDGGSCGELSVPSPGSVAPGSRFPSLGLSFPRNKGSLKGAAAELSPILATQACSSSMVFHYCVLSCTEKIAQCVTTF